MLKDLPPPNQTPSVTRPPQVLPPPDDPLLRVPPGFRVNLSPSVERPLASLDARWRRALRSSQEEEDRRSPARDRAGVAEPNRCFLDKASGTNQPFGMAFTKDAFYLGNTDAVLRYPYSSGRATPARRFGWQAGEDYLVPGKGYNQHWTRNVVHRTRRKEALRVGGFSVECQPRPAAACVVLQMNLDGSQRKVFASGLRNPVGLAFQPKTGELYATVNERDGLGDDLPPDYFTRLLEGDFYGWPYAYLAPQNLDPRLVRDGRSLRPTWPPHQDARRAVPDAFRGAGARVLHRQDLSREVSSGGVCRLPGIMEPQSRHRLQDRVRPFRCRGAAQGVVRGLRHRLPARSGGPITWGRPVGVLVLPDGSLLFTEEINGRIYRVRYSG